MGRLKILLKDLIYRMVGCSVFIPVSLFSYFKLKTFKPDSVGGILVFCWGGLGNLIMLLPFLKALKDGFRKAIIHVVTMNKAQYDFITQLLPDINPILMPREKDHIISGMRFLLGVLKGKTIDLSFHPYLEHTGRSIWWSRFLGPRIIVGFASPIFGPWQTVRLNLNKEISEGENYLNMLKVLNISVPLRGKLIELGEEVKSSARTLLDKNLKASGRIVGFHCGSSSFSKEKRWGVDKFTTLIKRLLSTYNDVGVVIFFGPDDSDLYEIYGNVFPDNKRVYLMKSAEILLFCACLEYLALFVTNDSGLMHLASAMGVPIVSIWGPTDPVKNRPWGNNFEIIRLGLDCSPCYRVGHINICPNRLCLEGITTEMVFDAVAKKL